VPAVADWAAVDLVDELGELSRWALATAEPGAEALAWSLVRAAPPDGLDGASVKEVLRGGQQWMAELDADALRVLARDPQHLRLLQESGLRAVMAVPLANRGRSLGVLWLAVTDPRRAAWGEHGAALARELAERASVALDNARLYREAQQANRVKDEFLATLSHELRTPLNAIVGWTHLLRTGELDAPTSGRALETIERNARLQSQLIADILDVTRIVSGKLRVESAPVDLAHVITAACDTVRPSAERKGVRLVCNLTAPALTVLGDAGRLQQVAQNLLQNAVKFTPKGGEVHAGLRRFGNAAELVVEDTGAGIAPDFLPHVFERFRQSDSSTTRPHGGLGLGLAITRHLVEAHGGSVEAASRGPGLGATFTVRLPALGNRAAEAPPAGDGETSQLAGVRVLVVDHAAGLTVLGTILERAGASVARAGTSGEAFKTMTEFQPHVLVSDLGLPDEDGFALMARVRSLPPEMGGGIPAVAVTGQMHAEEMARALRAGFQRHVARPIDPLELASVVAQLAKVEPRALD
jgi:signal transduction histidine kinase/ActR/RegA family two-component response regulator